MRKHTFIAGVVLLAVATAIAYDLSKEKITYEVGDSHLDTQWQWALDYTISTLIPNTLDQNFALFVKYPDYRFSFEGIYRYYLMKQYYPAKYAQLKQYVAQGKWNAAGGMVSAPDVILPLPESLIRATCLENKYYWLEFGKKPLDQLLPDGFGFGYTLPTIAAHCGVKGFSSYKTNNWGGAIATPFPIGRWTGIDGSSIVACLKPGWYGGGMDIRTEDGNWLKANSGTPGIWATYDYIGTGDMGGAANDADVSQMVTRIGQNASNDIKVYCTSSDQIFRDLTPAQVSSLPGYKGELLMTTHGTGSYTAHADIKLQQRKLERLSAASDHATVIANWLSQAPWQYPVFKNWWAWIRFLANFDHNTYTGCSVIAANTKYVIPQTDSSITEFTQMMTTANNDIAGRLDTRVSGQGSVPLVLYNPVSFNRRDLVEATVNFGTAAPAGVKVFDPDGKEVPAQITANLGLNNVGIAFIASIPPMSYSVYQVQPVAAANPANQGLTVDAATRVLENDYYKVTVNATGDISSVFSKKLNKELLASPSSYLGRQDNGTSFPAWEVTYAAVTGELKWTVGGTPTITVAETGPARVSLKVVRTTGGSTFTQYIRLAADSAGARVEVANTIDWKSSGTLLKVSFPVTCSNPRATFDLGLGVIQRPNATQSLYEVPAMRWADMTATDGTYGLSILNDLKYAWSKPSDSKLELTLIHSPVGGGYDYEGDLYVHNFKYALYGHSGTWNNGTVQQSASFDRPVIAFQTTAHDGTIKKSLAFLSPSSRQVYVMALKKAEFKDPVNKTVDTTDNNYVIRVCETDGKAITGAKITFAAEILNAKELNGSEDYVGPATSSGKELTFNMTPFSLKTFSINLGPYNPVAVNRSFADMVRERPIEMTVIVRGASAGKVLASITLPAGDKIRIVSITDARGRLVQKIAGKGSVVTAGNAVSEFVWNGASASGRPVGAGVYFVNVLTAHGSRSAPITVVR